jgi:hypothetical protein
MPMVGMYFETNRFSQYRLIRQDFPDFSAPTITIRTRIGRGLGPVGFDDLVIEIKVSVRENASPLNSKFQQ